jgi:hypothetical protein
MGYINFGLGRKFRAPDRTSEIVILVFPSCFCIIALTHRSEDKVNNNQDRQFCLPTSSKKDGYLGVCVRAGPDRKTRKNGRLWEYDDQLYSFLRRAEYGHRVPSGKSLELGLEIIGLEYLKSSCNILLLTRFLSFDFNESEWFI